MRDSPQTLRQAVLNGLLTTATDHKLTTDGKHATEISEHVRDFLAHRVQAAKFRHPRAQELLDRLFKEMTQ